MAKREIPNLTDAESELADLRQLRADYAEAKAAWDDAKESAKTAKELASSLEAKIMARLGDEVTLFDGADDGEE